MQIIMLHARAITEISVRFRHLRREFLRGRKFSEGTLLVVGLVREPSLQEMLFDVLLTLCGCKNVRRDLCNEIRIDRKIRTFYISCKILGKPFSEILAAIN